MQIRATPYAVVTRPVPHSTMLCRDYALIYVKNCDPLILQTASCIYALISEKRGWQIQDSFGELLNPGDLVRVAPPRLAISPLID